MDAIQEQLRPDRVDGLGDGGNIHQRAQCVRHRRAGHQSGPVGQQRDQVLDMQAPVIAHLPPGERRAFPLEGQPGGDVRVVVQIGDDDLAAFGLQRLADGQADDADERGGVHAEADLRGVAGVQPGRDLLARRRDDPVDLDALGVATAALDVEVHQMAGDSVQHILGRLGAGGVVEIDEGRRPLQRGKLRTNGFDGKFSGHESPHPKGGSVRYMKNHALVNRPRLAWVEPAHLPDREILGLKQIAPGPPAAGLDHVATRGVSQGS